MTRITIRFRKLKFYGNDITVLVPYVFAEDHFLNLANWKCDFWTSLDLPLRCIQEAITDIWMLVLVLRSEMYSKPAFCKFS